MQTIMLIIIICLALLSKLGYILFLDYIFSNRKKNFFLSTLEDNTEIGCLLTYLYGNNTVFFIGDKYYMASMSFAEFFESYSYPKNPKSPKYFNNLLQSYLSFFRQELKKNNFILCLDYHGFIPNRAILRQANDFKRCQLIIDNFKYLKQQNAIIDNQTFKIFPSIFKKRILKKIYPFASKVEETYMNTQSSLHCLSFPLITDKNYIKTCNYLRYYYIPTTIILSSIILLAILTSLALWTLKIFL